MAVAAQAWAGGAKSNAFINSHNSNAWPTGPRVRQRAALIPVALAELGVLPRLASASASRRR
eukprot:510879-Rhodomonas_salina.2